MGLRNESQPGSGRVFYFMKRANPKLELECFRDHVNLVQKSLKSADPREVDIAHAEYEDLIDEFAAAFGDYVAPQQIEAARQDPEYLLRLIELAKAYLNSKPGPY